MAKAIEQLRSGLVVGHALLGRHGQGRGGVAEQVRDGDTVTVEADGNFGVRFLGVDAPEVSVPLPGTSEPFVAVDDPRWAAVLADPVGAAPPFDPPLQPELAAYLISQAGAGEAANHARLAQAAKQALIALAEKDMADLDKTPESFRFLLAFAGEVMDRYGRLLTTSSPTNPTPPQGSGSLLQRAAPGGRPGQPVFHLAQHQPVPPRQPDHGRGASPRRAGPARRQGQLAAPPAKPWRTPANSTWASTTKLNHCGCCPSSCATSRAANHPTGGWPTCRATPPRCWPHSSTPRYPTHVEDRLFVPAEYLPLWQQHGSHTG